MAGAGHARDRMCVGVGVGGDPGDEQLTQSRQMGCSGVVVATPAIPWAGGWACDDLMRLRGRIESFDLRLEAIQHTPLDEFDQIRLGLPGREAALAHYRDTIRNLGRAGIPLLAYTWRPNRLYRTGEAPGRGGARVTTFALERAADYRRATGGPTARTSCGRPTTSSCARSCRRPPRRASRWRSTPTTRRASTSGAWRGS